jgi:hypothetical protein
MNERIRELARQAGALPTQDCGVPQWYIDEDEFEKFAELIVAECVTKLKETKKVELPFIQAVNEHAQELPLSVYIAELKQHFGLDKQTK